MGVSKKGQIQGVGPLPHFINQADCCRLLGVSASTLRNYRAQGLPKFGHGKFDPVAVVAWFKNAEQARGSHGDRPPDRKTAETRLAEARAVKVELENAEKQKEIVHIDQVAALVNFMATLTANSFEALAARLASMLAGVDEPAEIQAIILQESRVVRRQYAARLRDVDMADLLPVAEDDGPA